MIAATGGSPAARPGLDDITVLLVAGAEGLELEVARALVRAGTQRFGLVGPSGAGLEQVADEVRALAPGIWALFVEADPEAADDVDRATSEVAASLGEPDLVISCR